jgi:hypothetical protein
MERKGYNVFMADYLLAIKGPEKDISLWQQQLVKELELHIADNFLLVPRILMGCCLVASMSPRLFSFAPPNYKCYIVEDAIPDDYIGEELEHFRSQGMDREDFLVLEKRMMRTLNGTCVNEKCQTNVHD